MVHKRVAGVVVVSGDSLASGPRHPLHTWLLLLLLAVARDLHVAERLTVCDLPAAAHLDTISLFRQYHVFPRS